MKIRTKSEIYVEHKEEIDNYGFGDRQLTKKEYYKLCKEEYVKFEDIETELSKIFVEHNLKIVDCNEYDGKRFIVPISIKVSDKWILNSLKKRLSKNNFNAKRLK